MLVRLVLNSQRQVICPPWPPKVWDYRCEPPRPATISASNLDYVTNLQCQYIFFQFLKHLISDKQYLKHMKINSEEYRQLLTDENLVLAKAFIKN